MHKCMKITGIVSGLCILVKNHHLCFEKVPIDSTSMPSLTFNSYGDINQNRVKNGIFTFGTESCMKFRVKSQKMNVGKLMH